MASVRGFSVVQDEPTSVAGGMRGPTPTDYFMVSGTRDRRGLYGISGVDPAFQEIAVETRVSTTAPNDKVAEIARRTHRGCPIYATLRKETAFTIRLIVNGHPRALST